MGLIHLYCFIINYIFSQQKVSQSNDMMVSMLSKGLF